MLSLIVKIQDNFYGLASDQVEHIYPCPYIENNKLNYHGKTIRVIDLALFFKLRIESHYNLNTPLIIINSQKKIGLLVDEVVAVDEVIHKKSAKMPFLFDASWKSRDIKIIDLVGIGSESSDVN